MKEIFLAFLSSLPAVAASPLALVGLIVLVLAATVLFWKQSSLKSVAATLEQLPEADRLERIRLAYGVRPKKGVDAKTWLRSRRQEFFFLSFVATLLVGLLAFVVVYGRIVEPPGGAHQKELRGAFVELVKKLEAYELAARNMRDTFALAGANAIEPDPETDRLIDTSIASYNGVYDDLRTNQRAYLESVLKWLDNRPALGSEVRSLMQFVLTDVHQAGVIQFNDAAYRRTQQFRTRRDTATSDQAAGDLRLIRADGAVEIGQIAARVDRLLDVLAHRIQSLTGEILGTA